LFAESVSLVNFRNYAELSVKLSPHINILYGKNAQGKTSFLEALYLCSGARSPRTKQIKECIMEGKEEASIALSFFYEKTASLTPFEEKTNFVISKKGNKKIYRNGIEVEKLTEFYGNFPIVSFFPGDLDLIKNGPEERRRFMDMELCQSDKIYLFNLVQYQKALKQRNQLIKDSWDNKALLSQMEIWDLQLAKYGTEISQRRRVFLKDLQGYAAGIHEKLSSQSEKLEIFYEKTGFNEKDPETSEFLFQKLQENLEKDLRLGFTSIGPHRDDINIVINGKDARVYGSQGQQRTAALSLKLSEIDLLEKEIGEMPVLLLDDVMSELDPERQKKLLQYTKKGQVFITCASLENSIYQSIEGQKMRVDHGTITIE